MIAVMILMLGMPVEVHIEEITPIVFMWRSKVIWAQTFNSCNLDVSWEESLNSILFFALPLLRNLYLPCNSGTDHVAYKSPISVEMLWNEVIEIPMYFCFLFEFILITWAVLHFPSEAGVC